MAASKIIIGWREWVALPTLGIDGIVAKVDTGARSSALHVDEQWRFTEQGAPWVGFRIHNLDVNDGPVQGVAPIVDVRPVTDSGGLRTERPFIETVLSLAGRDRRIQLNLCSRGTMKFPMLIGRTAIRTRFLVDSNKSFLHGTPNIPEPLAPQ